ncbi:MAG: flavodoxin [Actinobacteria bacterium]|nr:MAG: flavodoxin [Actinomycetota bacterium]
MASGISRRQFVLGGAAVTGAVALGGAGYVAAKWAPEDAAEGLLRETMGDGMSKVLVVYGTKTGCTSGIAEKIGETLAAGGVTVDVKPAEDKPSPAGYDAIVVGSGIRASSWHGAVKEWVSVNADALKSTPTAFYTACLTMGTNPEKVDEVRAYTDPLIAETGVTPVALGLFAGMNDPKKFSLPERLIMKMMKAPEGDFRDFEAVAAWTTETAPLLGLS